MGGEEASPEDHQGSRDDPEGEYYSINRHIRARGVCLNIGVNRRDEEVTQVMDHYGGQQAASFDCDIAIEQAQDDCPKDIPQRVDYCGTS